MSYSPTGTTHPGSHPAPPHHHPHPHHPAHPSATAGKGGFLERVDFGEAIDAAVGTTAIAVAGDQLLKAGGRSHHRTAHLVKAGLGTAVALAALKLYSRDHKENQRAALAERSPKSSTVRRHSSESHRAERVKSPPHHTHVHEDGRHPGDYGHGDRLAMVPTRSWERRSSWDESAGRRRRRSSEETEDGLQQRHRSQSPGPHDRR